MPSLVGVVLGLTAAGCAVSSKLAAAVPLLPGAACTTWGRTFDMTMMYS